MTTDTDFERLQEFLKDYGLTDILCASADKAFSEAAQLRAAGYSKTAAKLEHLAEMLGDATVPEVKVQR